MATQIATAFNRVNGEGVGGRAGARIHSGSANLFPPTQLPGDPRPKVGDRDLVLEGTETIPPNETEKNPSTTDPTDPGTKTGDRKLVLDDDDDEEAPA